MSGFFYQIVEDAINYDNKAHMRDMYELTLVDMRDWCQEQMDTMSVPDVFAKYVILDLFAGDSEFPYKLWRYIQDTCSPDPEEEEDGEESE